MLDFRYYESSNIGGKAGVYTMHTDDEDSRKYMHHITNIKAYRGDLVE
jgi:hypothetical protein